MDDARHDVGETQPQRVRREDRHDKRERSKGRRDLVLMATLLIFLFGGERLIDRAQRTEARTAILDAIEVNCESDQKLRMQYRLRGELEIAVTEFLLRLARMNIEAGVDDNGQSQAFIDAVQPLAVDVEILPLPDCEAQRAATEAAIRDGQ